MKFTTEIKAFQAAMEMAGRMVKPSTLPILNQVHAAAREDGTITLRVWNFAGGIETTVQAEVETPGQFTIPAKHACQLLKHLSGGIEVSSGAGFSTIWKCGKSRHTLAGRDPNDCPTLPVLSDTAHSLAAKSEDLLHLLKNAAYAVATDKTRPILCSVLLLLAPGSMYAVATDTHRLAKIGRQDASIDVEANSNIILSTDTLSDFMALLPVAESACLQMDDKFVRASLSDAGQTVIILRTVEGQYPNWSRIIPAEFAVNFTFPVQETLEAVKRAALSVDSVRRLRLQIDGANLRITAGSHGTASDSEEEVEIVPAAGCPESHAFALKCDFLMDALANIGTEKAMFQCQANAMRPIVIEPITADGAPDRLALICTMQLV